MIILDGPRCCRGSNKPSSGGEVQYLVPEVVGSNEINCFRTRSQANSTS